MLTVGMRLWRALFAWMDDDIDRESMRFL